MRKILYAKPSITDLEITYVTDAVTNGWGDECYSYLNRFEEAVCARFNVTRAWATSSCHGALHIALSALGIGPGDEVIVPDTTWIGSVAPISWLGGKPVFVDVLPDTWCIDPDKIREAISKKTKAIIAVHLYGNVCEMDEILQIANLHGIPVIEDAAEAIGSEYQGRLVGSLGDLSVLSFHGTKTMTTGEGGMLLSNRMDLNRRIGIIEAQGRSPERHTSFWVDEIGLKYKMSNIQAALGLAQIERLDELVNKKRTIFSYYSEAFNNLTGYKMNPEKANTRNSYWMPTLVFNDSSMMDLEQLFRELSQAGISARPFFFPVSMFPMYKSKASNLTAYSLYKRALNLPSNYELSKQDAQYVAEKIVAKMITG